MSGDKNIFMTIKNLFPQDLNTLFGYETLCDSGDVVTFVRFNLVITSQAGVPTAEEATIQTTGSS